MPRVTVLYFAQAREGAGTREERISVPSGSSVGDLLEIARRSHPKLAGMKTATKVALNEELAGGDETLRDGDVVALIPPVAGG